MAHLRLGEILIKQGLISQEQLTKAIAAQQQEKGRIGEVLIKLGFIKEEDLSKAIGTQLGIPYYSSTSVRLNPQTDQQLERLVPEEFAKKNFILPLSKHMGSMTCAVFDPLDLLMLDNLKKISGCEINLVIATRSELLKAINNFYAMAKGEAPTTMLGEAVQHSYNATDAQMAETRRVAEAPTAELSLTTLIDKASEAPVIKLVDLIIHQAIDERASDIHIEPFENRISLRYRIDGQLYQIPPPAPHLHLPIISRIKILAKMDIAEKRLPQDGAISARLENRNVDIRISTIPTVWGEKIVMRILDKGAVPLELPRLGFDAKQVETIRHALKSPYGLFFVTGPTGSGKSTTLYSCLNEIIDPKKNILTVEDPVEFKIDGVNQVAIKSEIGLNFATALKAFLRQDPNIIMVGEVRDAETAQICVRAALTGHLVLSTLHTNDASSAVTRLVDIGVPPYLLTPSLVLIIAQRLARKLCQKCKEPYEPTPEMHGGIKFKSDLIYRAKGCEDCNHNGYKGRVIVAEVMVADQSIRQLIAKSANSNEIKDAARKAGMDTLFESGLKKVEEGVTSMDEILRVTVDQ